MTLGDKIKLLRKESGLTQLELGDKLGLSKANISKYEANVHEPSIETLNKLSDLFNVSVDFLLGRTSVRNHTETFAAHTDDEDLSDEARAELENFKDYLRNKYSK